MARTVADRERDYRALDMARRGFTHRQIAGELGWAAHKSAADAIKRALKDLTQVDADQVVKVMRERLDDYRRQAWRVLGRQHYVTSASGVVVLHPETHQPLIDDAPVLQALDRLLKYDIEERKMLGVDAPIGARVEVITESDVDAAIRGTQIPVGTRWHSSPGDRQRFEPIRNGFSFTAYDPSLEARAERRRRYKLAWRALDRAEQEYGSRPATIRGLPGAEAVRKRRKTSALS